MPFKYGNSNVDYVVWQDSDNPDGVHIAKIVFDGQTVWEAPYLAFDYLDFSDSYSIRSVSNVAAPSSLVIPSVYNGKSVTGIEANTAGDNTIVNITIPNSVTWIGRHSFNYCSITSLTVPDSVTEINAGLAQYCHNLDWVVLPSGITTFGNYCFLNSPITKVYYRGTEAQWNSFVQNIVDLGTNPWASTKLNLEGVKHYYYRADHPQEKIPDDYPYWRYEDGVPTLIKHHYTVATTKQPTCTATGVKTYTCSDCNFSYTETIPASGHAYAIEEVAATCTVKAHKKYTCGKCKHSYTDNYTGEPLGHAWVDATCTEAETCSRCGAIDDGPLGHDWLTTVYTWAADYSTCTATRACSRSIKHAETATAKSITDAVTKEPTCDAVGTRTYTATFTEAWAGTSTKTEDIAKIPHPWKDPTYSWNGTNSTCTATRLCNSYSTHKEQETVNTTSNITFNPTCTATGTRTYYADFTKSWAADQAKNVTEPALGHNWLVTTYDWADDGSTCTATRRCSVDTTNHVETATATISSTTSTPATCTTNGSKRCTATFSVSWATTQIEDFTIKATGHDPIFGGTKEAHNKCSVCQVSLNADHTYDIDSGEQYTAVTCMAKRKNYLRCACGYNPKSSSYVTEVGSIDINAHYFEGTGFAPVYTWTKNADGTYTCTATRACGHNNNHKDTATSTVTDKVKTAATCTTMGWTTYTADFNKTWTTDQTKDVQDIPIDPTNHTGSEVNGGTEGVHKKYSCCSATISTSHSFTNKATSSLCRTCTCGYQDTGHYEVKGGTSGVHAKCRDCGYTISTKHSYTKTTQTAATCTTKGTSKYTCSCGYSYTSQDIAINTSNHASGCTVVNAATATVCKKYSKCGTSYDTTHSMANTGTSSVHQTCSDCGYQTTTHSYTNTATSGVCRTCSCGYKITSHTMTNTGTSATHQTCSVCGYKTTSHTYNVDSGEQYTAASCTAKRKNYLRCSCGYNPKSASYVVETGSLLDHTWGTTTYAWSEYTTCTATSKCSVCSTATRTATATGTSITNAVTKAATCTATGVRTYTATFSGTNSWAGTSTKTETIPATDHKWSSTAYSWSSDYKTCTASRTCSNTWHTGTNPVTETVNTTAVITTSPTCTTKGTTTYTADFTVSWATDQTKAVQNVAIVSTAHSWNTPTYAWSGYTTCTATRTCKHNSAHSQTSTSTGTGIGNTITTQPTCTATGVKTYTATFNDSWAAKQTKTETVAATGHAWSTTYTWSSDYAKCTAAHKCGNDSSHDEAQVVNSTSSVKTAATCTTKGWTTYKADFTKDWATDQTKDVQDIAIVSTAHSWNAPTYSGNGKSSYTATRTCKHNSSHTETATASITNQVTTAATCTTAGVRTYTANFTETWATDKTTTEAIAALDHSWSVSYAWSSDYKTCTATHKCSRNSSHNETETVNSTSSVKTAATCTTKGWTTYKADFTKSWATDQTKDVQDIAIVSTAHSWNAATYSGDGKSSYKATRTCKHNSSHTESATATITNSITTQPTCTATGIRTYVANFSPSWAADKNTTESVAAKGHAWTVSYAWDGTNSTCTATHKCGNDSSHNETETVNSTNKITTSPTCTATGIRTFTADFTKSWATDQTKDVTEPKLGHDWLNPTYAWSGYTTCTATRLCSRDSSHKQTSTSTGTSITNAVTTQPTCTATGVRTYTAKFGDSWAAQQTKTETIAKAPDKHTGSSTNGGTEGVHTKYSCCGATISTSHSFTNKATASLCRTCTCGYNDTAHRSVNGGTSGVHTKCGDCGYTISSTHSYTNTATSGVCRTCSCGYKITSHSMANTGTSAVHQTCSNCGYKTTTHSYSVDSGVQYSAATCTAKRKNYKRCACGYNPKSASYVVEVGSALGHDWLTTTYTWSSDYKTCTAKHVCSKDSSHSESQTVNSTSAVKTAATCTTKGWTTYTATFTSSWVPNKTQTKDVQNIAIVSTAHTGSSTYGGTASVHTKYSCCGATISSSHTYDQSNTALKYLKSEATCTSAAVYYKSCACGYFTTSNSTFTSGSKNTSNHTGSSTYGGTSGVHTKYSCCGATISSSHTYDQNNTSSTYLKTAGTCTAEAVYYKSCKCGYSNKSANATFTGSKNANNHTGSSTYGGTSGVHTKYSCCGATISSSHSYDQSNTAAKYLKSAATCLSPAIYYKSCACGYYTTSNSTFTSGSKNANNHTGSSTNGGTSGVHTKYSCCGATISTTHSFTNKATSSLCRTCTCGYQDTAHRSVNGGTASVHTKCGDCGYTISSSHSMSNTATSSTCQTCACGYKTTSHSMGNTGTSAVHQTCSKCGYKTTTHTYNVDSGVQYTAATCTAKRKNYLRCSCGYNPTSASYVVEVGSANGHSGVYGGTASVHTKCSVCGTTTSSTHTYNQSNTDAKFLKSAANCQSAAVYYKSCACGYTDKSATFTSGSKNTSNHTGTVVNGGTADVHSKYNCCGATSANGSSHSYTVDSGVQYTAATCTAKRKNYKRCACGYNPQSASYVVETGSALGHNWLNTSYTWDSANSICTATRRCSADTTNHVENSSVASTSSVTKAATCTEAGNMRYTADFSVSWAVDQTKDVTIAAKGHTSANGGTASVHTKCSVCGTTITGSSGHSYTVDSGVQYTAATCTAKRKNYKRCACGYNPQSASYVVEVGSVNSSAHKFEGTGFLPVYTWTESNGSYTCTATRACAYNNAHKDTATAAITSKVSGTTRTYTATFSVSWATTQTKSVTIEESST